MCVYIYIYIGYSFLSLSLHISNENNITFHKLKKNIHGSVIYPATISAAASKATEEKKPPFKKI